LHTQILLVTIICDNSDKAGILRYYWLKELNWLDWLVLLHPDYREFFVLLYRIAYLQSAVWLFLFLLPFPSLPLNADSFDGIWWFCCHVAGFYKIRQIVIIAGQQPDILLTFLNFNINRHYLNAERRHTK
jgi:hypothetical protein